MNILLVNPPKTSKLVEGSYEQFKNIDIGVYPPLGLMYIAAYINEYSDYKVGILDVVCEKINYDRLYEKIKSLDPKAVGVYTSSFNIYDSYKVVKLVKGINNKIKTILGGPHIEIYPEESLNLPEVDFVVVGEGEAATVELLDYFVGKRNLAAIKGIGYKENGHSYFTERRSMISNLDELPFPARHLTKHRKYYSFIGNNKVATTIMSGRGCPHRCTFCYIPYQGTLRQRSAESVAREIEECIKLGIKEFFFFDENFTVNRKNVMNICEQIISRDLDITFYIRSRIDTIDEEMLERLKKAGCRRIQFGVESGSSRILEKMNKKTTIEKIENIFKLTRRIGIPIYADFMIGFPGETKEEMRETMEFAERLDSDFVQYGITMFLPKTKIYEDALKNGILTEDIWRNFARNPTTDISYPIASQDYSREELERVQYQAYMSFYFRPKCIFKRLFKIRSVTELLRQFNAAVRMLFSYKFLK